jgi:predicted HicB family RNase H-like nuclease
VSTRTMKYNGYYGSIEVSIEDNCLHGKLLFINDLVTYEAESPSALEGAFHQAVNFYLDKCKREGLSPNKPFNGNFNVRIKAELHRAACMQAVEENCSLNELVGKALEAYVADVRTSACIEN